MAHITAGLRAATSLGAHRRTPRAAGAARAVRLAPALFRGGVGVASRAALRGAARARSFVARAGGSDTEGADDGITLLDLERQLEKAIDDEEYEKAADLRDRLVLRRENNMLQVERANEKFYEAFREGSIREMRGIWGKGEYVQCIHPGAQCIAGSDSVLQSWEVIFSGGLKMEIELQDVRVCATDSMGFVTCIEAVKTDTSMGRVIATNVFEKNKDGEWKMVQHHGSHIMAM
mmetsp:Transcript_2487/g.8535  ORF Transcript_2487/g.8535 Transcript_2487/m.8535 type:complete len:233 (-) Transcript_2487:22-720(-)|eukprot:CAMPEP_0182866512 /NCGR_PEP_ID=MMETSP0034_2-20130328/8243_1 /TAXON_ID=156128 /ORGANISM="Nephroselmis pyriformis, Strain CCMP717" /LENGTH=232 /DNA_ID=CAMNT_0024998841 /DNA_START=21 /DNA_END=719 /DNA_ORIENTATION=-